MKSTHTIAALVIAGTAVLSGCSSTSTSRPYDSGTYPTASNSMGYGTIDSITVTRGAGQTSGAGAVVGGLVGAALGNQVGSGNGRTAATVAGAAAGAMVGNNVETNRNGGAEAYQIGIRLDNGEYRTVVQDSVYDLRVGNRVRVVDGRVYRY
jgi:outer membrane lipoprotein SlyB